MGVGFVTLALIVWAYREGEIQAKHLALIGGFIAAFAGALTYYHVNLMWLAVPITLVLCILLISLFSESLKLR